MLLFNPYKYKGVYMDNNKTVEEHIIKVMQESSQKDIDGIERDVIRNEMLEYRRKEIPVPINIDVLSFVNKSFEINDKLKSEKCSDKKIKRVMNNPLQTIRKLEYVNLINDFITEIRIMAYDGNTSKETELKLEEMEKYQTIMTSKDKNIVALKKSIPKLTHTVREMKAKDKTQDEIQKFMEKYLFSYIKLS